METYGNNYIDRTINKYIFLNFQIKSTCNFMFYSI